jgi:hypothetical protein
MKRPAEIFKQVQAIGTMVELTGVFKGIASMRIAQIKDQVLQSQDFFAAPGVYIHWGRSFLWLWPAQMRKTS